MNSYIVIEPKDIDEKVLIFNFLGSKSISKFMVTDDLKTYVSEKFNVKFIDINDSYMLANHQSGVESQVEQIAAKSTNAPFDNISSTDNVPSSATDINNTDTVMNDLVPKTEEDMAVSFHNTIDNTPLVDNTKSLTAAANNTDTGGILTEDRSQLNTRNDDEYGTFIPYRDRMVEPKEEVIEDADKNEKTDEIVTIVDDMPIEEVVISSVHNQQSISNENAIGMEEAEVEDDNDSLVINDTPALVDTNTPSTSTVRRSGRVIKRSRYTSDVKDTNDEETGDLNDNLRSEDTSLTRRRSGRVVKKPKYLMDDEDANEDDEESDTTNNDPVPQKGTEKEKSDDDNGIQCQKCLKQLCARYRDFSYAKDHAIFHTDMMRYECPVNGCGYKSGNLQNTKYHLKTTHAGIPRSARKIDLTVEQKEELLKMTMECFPGIKASEIERREDFSSTNEIQCQKCLKQLSVKHRLYSNAKEHAIIHTELKRFDCPVKECGYKSGPYCNTRTHIKQKHQGVNLVPKKIDLTTDQEKELDKVTTECFPVFAHMTRHGKISKENIKVELTADQKAIND